MEHMVRTRHWTRAEYDRLLDSGVFPAGEAVELLGGDVVVAEPQNSAHYSAICLAEDALRAAFGAGWLIRTQGPIALDDDSEPEPDVAAVPGSVRDYRDRHPARPALVVEAAESSLRVDRDHKGSLYARARLEDYWRVNLVERVLEICRQPVPDATTPFGWRYAAVQLLGPEATVSPLAAPGRTVRVGDLLP